MWMDAIDLRDFYVSPLGGVARRMIRRPVRALWPDVKGMAVLGLGYATPYLDPFRGEAERVLAAMPASQGVLNWPREGPSLTTLIDEAELPFPDLSIDRVLMVHALECTEQVRPLMREVWRVLTGSGRLIVVVPNRRGLWARFERTPFGYGRPYTPRQLSLLLRETLFTPVETRAALFVPPVRSRMMLSAAPAWEELGLRGLATFSGAIVTEATKEIYAGQPQAPARRRVYMPLANKTPGTSRG
jgi:SAM-dependent methyltransferase